MYLHSGSLSDGKGVWVEAAPQSAKQSISSKHQGKSRAFLDEDIEIQRPSLDWNWVDIGRVDEDYACCIRLNWPSSTFLVEST